MPCIAVVAYSYYNPRHLYSRSRSKLPSLKLTYATLKLSSRESRPIGPKAKNPPKIRFKKLVKLTDHACAFNDLTNFEYEGHAMTENANYVNLLKLA